MSDSEEPKPNKKPLPGQIGAPLPRLWKAEPEEESAEKEIPKKASKEKTSTSSSKKSGSGKKSKDGKKGKDAKDASGKGVLVEETPELDTYESRQRIRIAIGAVASVLFLVFCGVVYRTFAPSPKVEEVSQEDLLAATAKTATVSRDREELEAKSMLDRAKEFAKNGKADLSVPLLTRVSTKYPTTKAAKEAKAALERPKQNLPLFPDRPTVVATPGTSPKPTVPGPMIASVDVAKPTTVATPAMPPSLAPSGAVAPNAPPPQPSVPVRVSKALPVGFRPSPETEIHESGWPYEIVGERDDSILALVPGGVFIQGRDDSELIEGPAHEVKLSTYYMDKHEVTNRQFDLFQKEAGKRSERSRMLSTAAGASTEPKADFPVVMVSARDAKDYADWAGKNLPTEAQWEVAGRTSDGRIYPWGPTPPSWSRPRQPRQIDAVMSFPEDTSPYGVFDLSGNVWEWTKDWYESRYYDQFKKRAADDPTGAPTAPKTRQLVVKGSGKDWDLSHREGVKVEIRLPYLGFRCVLQVEGPGNAFAPKKPASNQTNPAAGNDGPGVPF